MGWDDLKMVWRIIFRGIQYVNVAVAVRSMIRSESKIQQPLVVLLKGAWILGRTSS